MENYLDNFDLSNGSLNDDKQQDENYDFLNDLDVKPQKDQKSTQNQNRRKRSSQLNQNQNHNNQNKNIEIQNNSSIKRNSSLKKSNIVNKENKTITSDQIQNDNGIKNDIEYSNNIDENEFESIKNTNKIEQNNQNLSKNTYPKLTENSNEFLDENEFIQKNFAQNLKETKNLNIQQENNAQEEDEQFDEEDDEYEEDFESNTNNVSRMNQSPNKELENSKQQKQEIQQNNEVQEINDKQENLEIQFSLEKTDEKKKNSHKNLLSYNDLSEIKVNQNDESNFDKEIENFSKMTQNQSVEKSLNKHPLRRVLTNQEKILIEKKKQHKQDSIHIQEIQQGTEQHSIRVMARVRPLIQIEKHSDIVLEVNQENGTLNFIDKGVIKEMKFWKTFSPESQQKDVFSHLKDKIKDVLNGYNFTILAYGQTGSGKTYSMFGADWEQVFQTYMNQNQKQNQHAKDSQKIGKTFMKQQLTLLENTSDDENFTGIMPRSIVQLFDQLNAIQLVTQQTYNVYCSFFQIYNEKIFDLLNENKEPLKIRTNVTDGLYIDGLSEFKSEDYADTIQIMKRGEQFRKIRETRMNTKSSRSHTIFRISLEEISENEAGLIKKSHINMVDLAGSEKINKSEVMSNEHLKELQNINQSLTTLGKVIHGLSHKGKPIVIPFRESNLTRILQESLSGNSKTFVLGTLSPSFYNIAETISTLNFLERAQQVKTKVKQNTIVKSDQIIIQKLMKEISYLKSLLNQKRTGNINEIQITQELKIKLMHLEDENQKLKYQKNPAQIQDIQKLLSENNSLKKQLQQFSNSNNQLTSKGSSIPLLPSIQNNQKNDLKKEITQEFVTQQNSFQINRSRMQNNDISHKNDNESSQIDVVTYKQNQFQIRVKGHNEITNIQSSIQLQEEKRNKEFKRILERINYINQAQDDSKQLLQAQLHRIENTRSIQNSQSQFQHLNHHQQKKEQLLKERQRKISQKYTYTKQNIHSNNNLNQKSYKFANINSNNNINNESSSNINNYNKNLNNNNSRNIINRGLYNPTIKMSPQNKSTQLQNNYQKKAYSNYSSKEHASSQRSSAFQYKTQNKAKTPLEKHKERMLKFQRELAALENQFP